MPGIMMSLLHGKSIAAGSLTRTTTGTFVVPAYSTLTVECRGKQGPGAGSFTGGLGGRSFKTYTAGAAGSPAVGASITITINATGSDNNTGLAWFAFGSTQPSASGGGGATDTIPGYEYTMSGDMYWQPEQPGSNGAPGNGYNGTVNQVGVCPDTGNSCILNWS